LTGVTICTATSASEPASRARRAASSGTHTIPACSLPWTPESTSRRFVAAAAFWVVTEKIVCARPA
jgi:hypothetical protein